MQRSTISSFPRRELGIASVCAGVLVLEICLTKLFSIVLWYHFGFLAVSTALLGFASSGVFLAMKQRQLKGADADPAIGKSAAIAAVAAIASLWLITQTRFDVQTLVHDRTIGSLLALVLWITLPFFFLGLTIARTLSAFPERVGRLYGADLMGSAVGCGLAVLLLSMNTSAQFAIVFGALLIALGGVMFAATRIGPLLFTAAAAAVPVMLMVRGNVEESFPLLASESKIYYQPIEQMDDYMIKRDRPIWRRGEVELAGGETFDMESSYPPKLSADGKFISVFTDDGPREVEAAQVVNFEDRSWTPYRRWNSMSRVDAFHWPAFKESCGLWGLSPKFYADGNGPIPRQKGITLDAWAFTTIMRYSGAPLQPAADPQVAAEREKLKVLEYLPAGSVHRVKKDADNMLVIGAGGGLDVLTAKYFGVDHITGVEINPGVVQSVREAFPEFAGHLYDPEYHPDIEIHVAEGRHYLERCNEQFDIIQLSGVDTLSSTEAGAFTLSENFLYTGEAFDSYLDHLDDDGVLTLTRWFIPLIDKNGQLEPRFSLRLLGLARQALEKQGLADAGKGIFYLNAANFTVILIKPDGFTVQEDQQLASYCKDMGFATLWSPHRRIEEIVVADQKYANPFLPFLESSDPQGYLASSRFDVTPPTDDRPFFFEISKFASIFDVDHYTNPRGLSAHGILVLLFLEVLALGFFFVIVPLKKMRAEKSTQNKWALGGLLIYFTAIGLGFILVEIVLSQKFVFFLGHPFFALSVILFSLLLFSGIGAALSSRIPLPRFATLFAGVIAVLSVLAFDVVFDSAIHLSLPLRIAISVGMLAPVGLMMGVPFPAGVRLLAKVEPQLIPWAWGVNGYTSVLGSVLAVMLGIELGFMTVLLIACGIYASGVVGYSLMTRKSAITVTAESEDEEELEGGVVIATLAERRYAKAQ